MTGIISMSAVAAVSDRVPPPKKKKNSVVVPKDFIDYTYGRECSFHEAGQPVKYERMDVPFDEGVRQLLFAMGCGRDIDIGMDINYGCIQGPRMPTKAEVERYRCDGCDVIGMVVQPEISLAHELSIPFALLLNVVGKAAADDPSERSDLHNYKDHDSFQKVHQMVEGV